MVIILSWNIFMRDYQYKWRIESLCKEIKTVNPDIICLQEVIPAFYDIIKQQLPGYSSAFIHPYKNNTTARAYGEVILSKLPIISKGFYRLESEQGRVNSWIDVKVNDKVLRVNTAHLESTEGFSNYLLKKVKGIRQKQLSLIKSKNSESKHWIWIGDSNLLEDENHEMFQSNIPTYFSNRFSYIFNEVNPVYYTHSYDKVWINNVTLEKFHTLSAAKDQKYLSDHDGIVCKINL